MLGEGVWAGHADKGAAACRGGTGCRRIVVVKRIALAWGVLLALTIDADPAAAQRAVTFRFTPTKRAQIAVWIESADGTRFATVGLTEATARRGIGNRPGASQMNSGYHWPYGRREGVLPIWAHRRAAVSGALLFPRVIFQNRTSEGFVSRTTDDSTPDSYFCLSFNLETTKRPGLDAITCASAFNGDKGRFIRDADITKGYGEPAEEGGVGGARPLDAWSLYPPRRDVTPCVAPGCVDSPDVASFNAAGRRVLPEIDTIAMATPAGDAAQTISFSVPADWPVGDYLASVEINTEGDYNAAYNETTYPTPAKPPEAWDAWSITYGYPFRGQPSVVFRLSIAVGTTQTASTTAASGYGSLSGQGPMGGVTFPIDATITNDPSTAPGSGVDRLRVTAGGYRLRVESTASSVDSDGGASDAASPQDASEDRAEGLGADRPADRPDVGQFDAISAPDAAVAIDATGSGGAIGPGLAARGRGASGCGCTTARAQSRLPGGHAILSLLAGGFFLAVHSVRRPSRRRQLPKRRPSVASPPIVSRPQS